MIDNPKTAATTCRAHLFNPSARVAPNLSGLAETLLFTLHQRVGDYDAIDFPDPVGRWIYDAIDYDFAGKFGPARDLLRTRSKVFDAAIRSFVGRYPSATVVELACGLETSFQRCDNGSVRWLCVDLPETIALRERFLEPTPRCQHLAADAFSLQWLSLVPETEPLFISVQGLLMYVSEDTVRQFLKGIFKDRRNISLLFDAVPPNLIKGSKGIRISEHYRLPAWLWGIDTKAIAKTMTVWLEGEACVEVLNHRKFLPCHKRPWFFNRSNMSIVRVASTDDD
ncbi:class I SAM-dependent methyltransferase [Rhizobium leguminosarum]|uniref:class I SAM-dependent methyltransferase n=1 Tax=Rhizobium TaxID=379 RepID=UPI00102F82FB|nr:class I SAM-dependent methyltransferase [Rhizobium leguminosarum]TBF86454.1 class I SAM-dependent methyltransferase [Rhizobium leguminosarum]TBG06914.1 class I SAM-dependent methyltransferase [Rhizobium leguminosarum]TBG07314.1 class I SAM-dependent methyltransferase [Rhizobium leguminosarum]TBG29611.1 class I SAM-dependent methyltransferase [Rhizobium leguminosarum]TBG49684.1 class I SAM-dependent methyltransferase [Rhizobium leguminosarum]